MNRWSVAVAAVVMQLGLGSLYAWSVFRQPLSAHYGADVLRGNRKGANRVTFLLAPDGTISKTYPEVTPDTHADEILEDASSL
jgi:peroxiredoxin